MTKQERIDELTDEIKEAITLRNEFREQYVSILKRLYEDTEITSADLNPIGNRVLQILVVTDMIAMQAVQQNLDVEFIQSLKDDLEVHEAAYHIHRDGKAKLAEARQRAEERKAQEAAAPPLEPVVVEEDFWPDVLPIH